ncbi:MAG: RNA 2',3'-cyclic phosphodiesterase [Spirochaetota bacterium]
MRTFLAADIDEKTKSQIISLLETFKKSETGIKWVSPDGLHITLYFFGEVKEPGLEALESMINESVKEISPFSVLVGGLSGFPSLKKPRVIWAGVDNPSHELETIFSSVRQNITKMGLRVNKEKRSYTPHITMGRVKRRVSSDILKKIDELKDREFGRYQVNNVVLYKSTLTSKGAVYEPLKVFNL